MYFFSSYVNNEHICPVLTFSKPCDLEITQKNVSSWFLYRVFDPHDTLFTTLLVKWVLEHSNDFSNTPVEKFESWLKDLEAKLLEMDVVNYHVPITEESCRRRRYVVILWITCQLTLALVYSTHIKLSTFSLLPRRSGSSPSTRRRGRGRQSQSYDCVIQMKEEGGVELDSNMVNGSISNPEERSEKEDCEGDDDDDDDDDDGDDDDDDNDDDNDNEDDGTAYPNDVDEELDREEGEEEGTDYDDNDDDDDVDVDDDDDDNNLFAEDEEPLVISHSRADVDDSKMELDTEDMNHKQRTTGDMNNETISHERSKSDVEAMVVVKEEVTKGSIEEAEVVALTGEDTKDFSVLQPSPHYTNATVTLSTTSSAHNSPQPASTSKKHKRFTHQLLGNISTPVSGNGDDLENVSSEYPNDQDVSNADYHMINPLRAFTGDPTELESLRGELLRELKRRSINQEQFCRKAQLREQVVNIHPH